MAKINYLLGRAERLVRKIDPPKIKPNKAHPYTFEQAVRRIVPKLREAVGEIEELPVAACPDDEAVVLLTLHPAYFAKSYFPDALFDEAHLRSIGSRQRVVSPDAWAIKNPPAESITAEIFVAGTALHGEVRMRGRSLQNPDFDIHYNAREAGGKAGKPQDIQYALIVSVRAPKVKDFYDRIFRRYRTQLEALRPVIEIPLRGS